MSEDEDRAVLTEPVVVRSAFVTGTAVEAEDTYVRIIAWEQLPTIEGDRIKERRIVLRAAMPSAVARVLLMQLRNALAKGGH